MQLDGQNQLVAGKEQALSAACGPRKEAYDGPGGLTEKAVSIKKATSSQYGTKSAQYAQVKGIKV